ncbi:MAG: GNAT family N-acetyltransferase, partial [Longimicrobiales bacterium]
MQPDIAAAIAGAARLPWRDQLPAEADWDGYAYNLAERMCQDAHVVNVPDCGFAVWRSQPWDSALLGVHAGRVDFFTAQRPDAVAQALRDDLERAGTCYVSARLDAGAFDYIQALNRAGFELVDGIITFGLRIRPESASVRAAPDDYQLRLATPQDADALAEMGAPLFRVGRLHADPRIPRECAERMYAEWIRNSCRGSEADAVWIAQDGQEIIGYLTVKTDRATRDFLGFPIMSIVLAGVVPRARRLGVATRLTENALEWARAKAIAAVTIGTQLNNIATARLFEG